MVTSQRNCGSSSGVRSPLSAMSPPLLRQELVLIHCLQQATCVIFGVMINFDVTPQKRRMQRGLPQLCMKLNRDGVCSQGQAPEHNLTVVRTISLKITEHKREFRQTERRTWNVDADVSVQILRLRVRFACAAPSKGSPLPRRAGCGDGVGSLMEAGLLGRGGGAGAPPGSEPRGQGPTALWVFWEPGSQGVRVK